MTDTVIVTEDLLEKGKSARGGWTKIQTVLLGLSWPLVRGWKRVVIGREIPRADADRFVALGTDPSPSAKVARRARQAADRQITCREADEDLLRRAVSHLGVIARRRRTRWSVARDLFGTREGSSRRLCLRFGYDPDSVIGPSEWELVERAVCSEDEELTVERWEEIFPGVDPPPEHERR